MQLKDKFLLVCLAILILVCLGSIAWGCVLDYRLRNNSDTGRVRNLEDRIVDLEKQLASGQSELEAAQRELDGARIEIAESKRELDEYAKRLDIGAGAIGRGQDATERIGSIIEEIKKRGIVAER